MTEPMGRRERKKAQTRKALADAALEMFLERGYDNVGVREVADAADVSVTTLFKYFPTKESLVFDIDTEVEAGLVAAVRDRAPGTPMLHALRDHFVDWMDKVANSPTTEPFSQLVETTPALRDYATRMWVRHEKALARAIAEDAGAPEDDVTCAILARFALEAVQLGRDRPDPVGTVEAVFDLLEKGWAATSEQRRPTNPPT